MGIPISVTCWSQTLEAVADTAAFAAAKFLAYQGIASPFAWNVTSILLNGQDTAATACIVQFARDSTVGLTPTGTLSAIAALNPSSAVPRGVQFTNAATRPQRSATLKLATLDFNSFGGEVLLKLGPGEEFKGVGSTASFGEMSLSGFTGSGLGKYSATLLIEEM